MLLKSFNRLGIGISPPSRILPISFHQRCRRLDPRRSLPCMTDSLNKSVAGHNVDSKNVDSHNVESVTHTRFRTPGQISVRNICHACYQSNVLVYCTNLKYAPKYVAPKICQNALALADEALPPGQTTMGEHTMLPKFRNSLKIGISSPSRISPISLHRRCKRLDPRRSLTCMTDSLQVP